MNLPQSLVSTIYTSCIILWYHQRATNMFHENIMRASALIILSTIRIVRVFFAYWAAYYMFTGNWLSTLAIQWELSCLFCLLDVHCYWAAYSAYSVGMELPILPSACLLATELLTLLIQWELLVSCTFCPLHVHWPVSNSVPLAVEASALTTELITLYMGYF